MSNAAAGPLKSTWRNEGAPFELPDGTVVERRGTFRAVETDPVVVRRRQKLRRLGHGAGRRASAAAPSQPAAVEAEEDDVGEEEAPESRFAGVDFASDEAYELARAENAPPDPLRTGAGTGKDGAWRKQDVADLLTELRRSSPEGDGADEAEGEA